MARGTGTANLAASLEVLAGAPLDARDTCPTVEDLYLSANWPYKYIGMKTVVLATGDTYRLVDLDVTQESSWVLDGGGTGGQTIQVDIMPTASVDELGNIYQYIGATDSTYTNGYFYKCVYENSAYSWVQHNVQPHDTPTQELTSAELAEVKAAFDPTGSSVGGYPILFDEGGIERQVGWYRYSNGTKKPVYEKIVSGNTANEEEKTVYVHDTYVDVTNLNIDKIINLSGILFGTTGSMYIFGGYDYISASDNIDVNYIKFTASYSAINKKICFRRYVKPATDATYSQNADFSITIRYTKTTDTPA